MINAMGQILLFVTAAATMKPAVNPKTVNPFKRNIFVPFTIEDNSIGMNSNKKDNICHIGDIGDTSLSS